MCWAGSRAPARGVHALAVTALGWWATARGDRGRSDKDPSEIVIDEVVGQWIALWPVSFGAQMAGADVLALWPGIVAAFVLFRLFDIWKPGPVGWADRQPATPLGVMLDDIVAGWLAALVVAVLPRSRTGDAHEPRPRLARPETPRRLDASPPPKAAPAGMIAAALTDVAGILGMRSTGAS
jgi:hypothetical protein